jgi:xanthine dehydrogenase YagR molybdenum-binding subunit
VQQEAADKLFGLQYHRLLLGIVAIILVAEGHFGLRDVQEPLSVVRVTLGDTDAPDAPAAGRSAQTASVAPAVQREAAGTPQGRGRNLSFYSFGAHFVEARVDEELGRLGVARVVTVLDCGRILNPKTAASQVKGAVVFGIGMALMEQTIYDPNTARVLTDNLADYQCPGEP